MGKANLVGVGSGGHGGKLPQTQSSHVAMALAGGGAYQPQGLQNQKAGFHNQKKFLHQMGKVSAKNSQKPTTQGSQNRNGKLYFLYFFKSHVFSIIIL